MKNVFLLLLITLSCLPGCKNDDDHDDMQPACGVYLTIDKAAYAQRDSFISIVSMSITDNCLSMELGFSGCDADHDIELITTGDVAESLPVQITFGLKDKKAEACQAYFTRSFEYDLSPLLPLLTSEQSARLIFRDQSREILWNIKH